MLRTETVSQEFTLAAIIVMGVVILAALVGIASLHALALPGGVGVAFWLAGMWCDIRGV